MDNLTPEELALLADEAEAIAEADEAEELKPRRGRKAENEDPPAVAPAPTPSILRGPHTPVQFHDDGWAGLPVQMRG